MNDFLVQHHRKFAAAGLVAVTGLVLFFGGCFGDGTTSVAGQVTSAGKPVTWGTVTVIASDNKAYSAPLQPDGSYQVTGVPRGPVRIAVSSPNPQSQFAAAPPPPAVAAKPGKSPPKTPPPAPPRGGGGAAGPAATAGGAGGKPKTQSLAMEATTPPPPVAAPSYAPKNWAPIPGKYANPDTSGINTEAGRGSKRLDIKVD